MYELTLTFIRGIATATVAGLVVLMLLRCARAARFMKIKS